jgi:hypothetical protein
MRTIGLLLLVLLPSFGHAVICQTLGDDGEVSYTNLEGTSCPQGHAVSPYRGRVVQPEQAQQLAPDVVGRTLSLYRSLRMVNPPADGVIRDNSGSFTVEFALEPSLRSDHFLVVDIDGRTFRGRYGSPNVEVAGLDQGKHQVSVSISDSDGAAVYSAEPVSFSLLRTTRNKVIRVDAIAPRGSSTYLVQGVLGGGPMSVGATVTIRFDDAGTEYKGVVAADKTWSVVVGSEPASHAEFTVTATTPGNARFERVQQIHPGLLRPSHHLPSPGQGYTPPASGIPATPGQTNPAFAPRYTP